MSSIVLEDGRDRANCEGGVLVGELSVAMEDSDGCLRRRMAEDVAVSIRLLLLLLLLLSLC